MTVLHDLKIANLSSYAFNEECSVLAFNDLDEGEHRTKNRFQLHWFEKAFKRCFTGSGLGLRLFNSFISKSFFYS